MYYCILKFISEQTDISRYHNGLNLLASFSILIAFISMPSQYSTPEGYRISRNSLDTFETLQTVDPHLSRTSVSTARRNTHSQTHENTSTAQTDSLRCSHTCSVPEINSTFFLQQQQKISSSVCYTYILSALLLFVGIS